jgi:hypothetical protein
MKKIFFYFLLAIWIYTVVSMGQLLFYNFQKLTAYGYGILTGKILLILIIGFIAYKIRPQR